MHQPSPSPGRPKSQWLTRTASQPSSLDSLSSSITFVKAEVSDTAGFFNETASTIVSAARSIDRAALRELRAKRVRDEEIELEDRENMRSAASLCLNTPPMSATPRMSAIFAQPGVISRKDLHRLRAARLHAEERDLDRRSGGGGTAVDDATVADTEPPVPTSHLRGHAVLQPRTNVFMTDLPSRSKLQALRAERSRGEEKLLEAREAELGRPQSNASTIPRPSMQQRRASRVHMEEFGLYSQDRRRLQHLRAQRLHDEERILEAAATRLTATAN